MRNAATFDDDFGYDGSRRRAAAPRKPHAASGKGRKGTRRGYRLDMRKVVRYVAVGLSTSLVAGIAFNALVLQKSRHPAPLFGQSTALAQATAPVAAKVAAPPAVPEPETTMPAPIQPPAPAKPRRTALAPPDKAAIDRAAIDKAASERTTGDDSIARLINGAGKGPARAGGTAGEKAPEKPADPSQVKTITGVQHALAKLGFPVKATGTLGPQTHKAIEAFEKDRHMPVTGEMSRRLAKVLAAESGLKLD